MCIKAVDTIIIHNSTFNFDLLSEKRIKMVFVEWLVKNTSHWVEVGKLVTILLL